MLYRSRTKKHLSSMRDSLFTSKSWTAFCTATNTNRHVSTSYHPQTGGQIERAIRTIEQILCCFVADHQNSWGPLL